LIPGCGGSREGSGVSFPAGFIQLQRKPVGVGEEDEALLRVFVHPDGFDLNATGFEQSLGLRNVFHREGEVTQTARFWIRGPGGGVWKGEQLNLSSIGKCEVQLVGHSGLAIVFGDDFQSEDVYVKALGGLVVRADDGCVVDA
jgi:hypothetical protein